MREFWSTSAGGWVQHRQIFDSELAPFGDVLIETLAPGPGTRLLDIGCGTGTLLELAAQRGATGVGVDISPMMIEAATERVPAASFIVDDAQTDDLAAHGPFDAVTSRFGVMFFDDPARAFTNLRRAAAPEADLNCVVWRSAAENPFMTTAERAAAPFLPEMPPRKPDEPGQFAFADRARVESILRSAGWTGIDIQPLDVACTLPERDLNPYITRLGPLGRVLQQVDERERARIVETVRAAFDPYVQGTQVRFTAACWTLAART